MTEDELEQAHDAYQDLHHQLAYAFASCCAAMIERGFSRKQIEYVATKLGDEFRFWV